MLYLFHVKKSNRKQAFVWKNIVREKLTFDWNRRFCSFQIEFKMSFKLEEKQPLETNQEARWKSRKMLILYVLTEAKHFRNICIVESVAVLFVDSQCSLLTAVLFVWISQNPNTWKSHFFAIFFSDSLLFSV